MSTKMEDTWRRSVRSVFQPSLLARLFLAAVFVATGLLKAQRFGEFEATLAASNLVPTDIIPAAAVGLIILELSVALGLFLWTARPAPVTIARLLFSTFISYHVWRWVMQIPVPCHCFGALFTLPPLQGIALNFFLLFLTFQLPAVSPDAAPVPLPLHRS